MKMPDCHFKQVDELIEILAEDIIRLVGERAEPSDVARETKALAKLISARTSTN